MNKILSIDFDFFVDCHSIRSVLDTQHFRGEAWKNFQKNCGFGSLEQAIPFTGPPFSEFLSHFDFSKTQFFCPAESHSEIIGHIGDSRNLELVNVDSHHDICYCRIDELDISSGHFDCATWGGHLLVEGRIESWIQVYPAWRKKFPESLPFPVLCKPIPQKEWLRDLSEIKFSPDLVFVCRSSPWVPPCYDGKFEQLCRMIVRRGRFVVPENRNFRFPRE